MAGDTSFSIQPRRGEYVLFDRTAQDKMVRGIVFPVPTENSKGILVGATTHGNVFIGPNAQDIDDREDLAVTADGMAEIMTGAKRLLPRLPLPNLPGCEQFPRRAISCWGRRRSCEDWCKRRGFSRRD